MAPQSDFYFHKWIDYGDRIKKTTDIDDPTIPPLIDNHPSHSDICWMTLASTDYYPLVKNSDEKEICVGISVDVNDSTLTV